MPYEVTYTLQDAASQKTTLNIPMGQFGFIEGDPFEFNLVMSAVSNIEAGLSAVTQANIIRRTVSYVRDMGGGDGLGDIADEVFVSARLDTANPAYFGVRIPAPVPALINADGISVDVDNADFVNYLATLLDHGRFGAGQNVEMADPVETLQPFVRSVKRKRK